MAKPSFTQRLRRLIDESAIPRNQIGKATDIDPAVLCRFMAGRSGLSLKSLDRLFEFLDLEIKKRKG